MLDCHVAEDVMGLVALAYHPDPKPASAHTPAAPNHKPMSKLDSLECSRFSHALAMRKTM